ncbi:MAG: transcription antitermination factor NusB [Chitinophagaceae bacterium]|nr:transcription antitermination factor NusB [Chitinophagaceae bacterium]
MISRRNIRVKVMQTLYTLETSENNLNGEQSKKILENHLGQTTQLFVYLVYFLTETARYAETDARLKAAKHLPTEEDLHVNTKIAGNEVLWKIIEEPSYVQAVKTWKPETMIDHELVKKIYQQLTESPEYIAYINTSGRDKKEERKIFEFIFSNLMLPNEDFIAHIEEYFIHWDDDAEMLNLLMLNYLQKPGSYNFRQLVGEEKMQFARNLLQTAQDKKEYCQELIKPKLKNWDPDRIALLDMIIMRMGVCEFLYFETIPTKVTINEYIDLAKEYSTAQSGQFVNGILDNIHKDLLAEKKLHKVDFKKQ